MSTFQEQSCFDEELLSLMKQNDEGGNIVACSIIETKNLFNLANKLGDTLLHVAAKYHNIAVIKYLIDSGLEANAKNIAGKTPILLAVEARNPFKLTDSLATVEILCESGANIYITDNDGNCAVQLFLDEYKFNEHWCDPIAKLFLRIIEQEFSNDSQRIAEKLLSLNCPLWQAVYLKNADVIEQMIKAGRSVNSCHPNYRFTVLHQAVALMDLKTVETLVRCGADLNSVDSFGKTVLWSYCRSHPQIQDPKILKILLNGMTFQNDEDQIKHMRMILSNGTKESIKVLLEYDNNILNIQDPYGDSFLHRLAMNKNSNVTEAIQDQKFDVNACDVKGCTPLHLATSYSSSCHSSTIKFLLNNGADVHVKCNDQISPIFSFIMHGKFSKKELHQIIVMFLERNVDVQMVGPCQTNKYYRNTQIIDHKSTLFDIIMMKRTFYMAKPILAHLALQEELGTVISDHIRNKIDSHQMFKNHFDLCKRKLKKMKNNVIKGKLTLFQILVDSRAQFTKCYIHSEDIILKLENLRKKCRSKYYYDAIIRKRIPNVILEIQLICKVAPILNGLLRLKNNKNHIVVPKIIQYLDCQDVKILNEIKL